MNLKPQGQFHVRHQSLMSLETLSKCCFVTNLCMQFRMYHLKLIPMQIAICITISLDIAPIAVCTCEDTVHLFSYIISVLFLPTTRCLGSTRYTSSIFGSWPEIASLRLRTFSAGTNQIICRLLVTSRNSSTTRAFIRRRFNQNLLKYVHIQLYMTLFHRKEIM